MTPLILSTGPHCTAGATHAIGILKLCILALMLTDQSGHTAHARNMIRECLMEKVGV